MSKMKAKNSKDSKSDDDTIAIESSPLKISTNANRNGLLCPKSVRNNIKKTQKSKEKIINSDKESKDFIKSTKDVPIPKFIKKSVTKVSDNEIVEVLKINNESVDWPLASIKHTDTKPSLIYSYNPSISEPKESNIDSKHLSKNKKKKKHVKSKVQDISDNEGTNLKKMKKNRKSKKKKNKDSNEVHLRLDKEIKKEDCEVDTINGTKTTEIPKSFLVSYSSDEEENNAESSLNKKSPEIKSEMKCNLHASNNKCENKIEIKLKPTKSPGKSTWESSESEVEAEPKKCLKEIKILQVKSPNLIVKSPQIKKSKSNSAKSISHSLNGSHSSSRSVSQSSYSSSRSGSYSDYSGKSSRSYSRSRSHSKSKRHSRRRRHYSSSSSSYSRSRSRYHTRSSSRSTSYSRSTRSYSRSRSRYKSSYSSRYRSRSRSRSSRSRSNSYYRSSYRKRKRSSSTDRFLNVPTRKVKTTFRNSVLQGGPPKHVDIGKKIDAIKESQRKALENQNSDNASSLNIPLPPEKPKGNLLKMGESYTSLDLIGPVAKKSKKNNVGNKNTELKTGDKGDHNQLQYLQPSDYNYIGPQVSSDMAKRLGLDVKSNITKKENGNDNYKTEPLTSDSFVAPTLDAAHMALQSRAYQHRLFNLQGSNNQDIAAQAAQYYHPLYMSASSLSNNLTAIASAAVANEQLPASVAGSLAQAAVQRIMSSSNLTATYNTPSVMTSQGGATLQTALHNGLPSSCGTFVANTPSGLIPISLLQQGGFQIGINPLILQQLQQQAINAQFGQAISLPNQHILSNVNQFLLQAQNQQALLQSLGVNAQAQLLGSPLNIQHSLLMAAQQQQQQQQLFAAAQINQATLQAAHLQAQIQAQARAVSLQNLQQAAQMQSSAQSAATISMAAVLTDENVDVKKHDNVDQISLTENEKSNIEGSSYIYSDQNFYNEIHSLQHSDNATVISDDSKTASVNVNESQVQYTLECDNTIGNTDYNNTIVKQQAPRIIYSSPAVIETVNISSPVLKP